MEIAMSYCVAVPVTEHNRALYVCRSQLIPSSGAADSTFVECDAILRGTLQYGCPNKQSRLKQFFIGISGAASMARSRAVAVDLASTNLGNRANGGKFGQTWQAATSMQKSKHSAMPRAWCHSTLPGMYCSLIIAT